MRIFLESQLFLSIEKKNVRKEFYYYVLKIYRTDLRTQCGGISFFTRGNSTTQLQHRRRHPTHKLFGQAR